MHSVTRLLLPGRRARRTLHVRQRNMKPLVPSPLRTSKPRPQLSTPTPMVWTAASQAQQSRHTKSRSHPSHRFSLQPLGLAVCQRQMRRPLVPVVMTRAQRGAKAPCNAIYSRQPARRGVFDGLRRAAFISDFEKCLRAQAKCCKVVWTNQLCAGQDLRASAFDNSVLNRCE